MRPLQVQILAPIISSADRTSQIIDMRQIVAFSVQAIMGTGAVAGTVQLQISNTPCTQRFSDYVSANTPVWVNLGSPLSISQASTASSSLITKQDSSYIALRALFSSVPGSVSTIVAVPDSSGSLNNTYFLYSSNTTAYYVWFDNGSGVDPALTGRTGIHITYSNNATAATLGGLMRAAMVVTGVAITGATTTVIATGATASDGAAPTGFNFTPSSVNTGTITLDLAGLGL